MIAPTGALSTPSSEPAVQVSVTGLGPHGATSDRKTMEFDPFSGVRARVAVYRCHVCSFGSYRPTNVSENQGPVLEAGFFASWFDHGGTLNNRRNRLASGNQLPRCWV